jgi:DNA recombination protein RmuC
MEIVFVALGLLAGIGAGAAVAVLAVRSAHRRAAIERDDAVAAVVAQLSAGATTDLAAELAYEREQTVLALRHEMAVEREQSLRATIDTVLNVAGDKLGSHTAAASQELGHRSEHFEQQVAGMNDELRQVRQLVAQLQKERAEQQGQLVQGISEAVRASTALNTTTQSLREALSNSRARGQWGERMAEDVLRAAGFIEGINYRKQHTLAGGGRPDLTVLLPRDRLLHMDVKFPIDNYLRHLEAADDHSRALHTKAFLKDVRGRIKELAVRDYVDPDTTVGYVLLFIPNEAVYGFIHEHDARMLDEALGQQVVLCSPFSLFAVLGVVRQSVENHLLERTSDEILQCLGGFTKQWTAFSDKLDRLGSQFVTAQKTYDELAGTRRRAMQKQLDQVDRLRSARGLDDLAREAIAINPVPDLPLDDDLEPYDVDRIAASGESHLGHAPGTRRVPRLRPLR